MVLHRSHGNFFGVKVKTVKLIGGRRFLAARSGLNAISRFCHTAENHCTVRPRIWDHDLLCSTPLITTIFSDTHSTVSGQREPLFENLTRQVSWGSYFVPFGPPVPCCSFHYFASLRPDVTVPPLDPLWKSIPRKSWGCAPSMPGLREAE